MRPRAVNTGRMRTNRETSSMNSISNNAEPTKRCTKCGEEKPATNEYFARAPRRKDGLECWCKSCKNAYHASRKDAVNAKRRENYDPVKAHIEWEKSYAKHSDKRKAYVLDWRRRNPDKTREYHQNWAEKNPDKVLAKGRRWVLNNPEKAMLRTQRRLARKRDLPDTMTDQDWIDTLAHFDNCCAVCGKFPEDRILEADHWIPLNSPECPGTVPSNMIPLCGGKGGCNPRKSDTMPLEWLVRTYGEITALEIFARISDYLSSK